MKLSKYPKHKFSAFARKKLKKVPATILHTTLITPEGPAVGTIWYTPSLNNPFTVRSVADGRIEYDDHGWDTVPGFLSEMRSGGYILVGVSHSVESYVPNIIA